jgi:chromosome partitioning protein
VFDSVIPRSVRAAEAPSHGLPVTEHAPSSRATAAYRRLARELDEREADRIQIHRTERESSEAESPVEVDARG